MSQLLLIGFCSFGIIGTIFFIEGLCEKKCKVALFGVTLWCLGIGCLAVATYASKKYEEQPWHRTDPYVTHTIMALQDGNEINGSFRGGKYSMSGYINEEFLYVYGYKTIGGGMKIQKVSEKNAVVYFNDDVTPNAKWYEETKSFWWLNGKRYTCDIFIPSDSLQAELVIDLQ